MCSQISDWLGFFLLLDKGNKTGIKCRVPSPSSISMGLNSFLDLQNQIRGCGDSRESNPKNSCSSFSCGSSMFFQVFSPVLLGIQIKFQAQILRFAQANTEIRRDSGSFPAGSRNSSSNPDQEEFPGWKVEFPFLRQFDT